MEHKEGTFAGAGGLELYYQCWRPEGESRAVLAITHGMGEHSGRYQNVVDYLVPLGCAIYGFDLRGHGRSPGQRGYASSIADFREDVSAFLRLIKLQEPNSPLFLLGHSLGGLIALECVLRDSNGLQGVIASGPLLGQTTVSPLLMILARLLSRIWPRFALDTGLDATALSRNPAVVEAYQQDPMVHGKGTARLGAEVATAMAWCQEHAAGLRVPLLIIHGSEDRLVPVEASQVFFDNVTFTDKERIEYEGGYHEPHNDIIYPQVVADLGHWLEAHL